MKKINLFLALFLMFSITLTAQKKKEVKYFSKNTKNAEKAFNEDKFAEAIELFEKAYPKAKGSKEKGFITYKLGVSYQSVDNNAKAKSYYERALRFKYERNEPDLYTRLAQMQMQFGEYKKAKKNYEMGLKKNPKDAVAKDGMKAIKKVNDIIANPTKHKVEAVKELNSEYYDWSFTKFDKRGEQFIFASTRKSSTGGDDDETFKENYTDLFVTRADRQGNFGEPVSVGEGVNTKDHEGSAVMYNNGKSMFFTRCMSVKNENQGCKIYTTDVKGKSWKTPVLIELSDSMGYSEGHPATDRKGTFLIFSSDMPGGHGGKDLWVSAYNKRSKEWSNPMNLGPQINTAADEKFPTMGKDGSLYFSSNGLPGVGGLDIFKATRVGNTNKWEKPVNMGVPINSSRDDHGITYITDNSGYFSSSRMGRNEQDLKSDIYKFSLPECALTIKGRVRDQDTKEPLAGATVILTGSDGSTATIKADSEGNFEFGKRGKGRYIKKGVNYTLEYSHEKDGKFWLKKKSKRTTIGDYCNETFYEDIELLCAIGCKPIIMPEVQYEFATAIFVNTPQVNSADSLLFLYNIMIDNPTIKVQLEAHTDCRGGDEPNRILSQKRAQACVDYLISKGIDRSRLVAMGFGESQPRVITENGKDITLGCDMITGLKTSNPTKFEEYHQLNRRTTFSVIPQPKK